MKSINSTLTHQYKSNRYILIALGLLNVLVFTLLLCALSLLVGFTISKWQFPLACVFALVVNYYAAKFFANDNKWIFFLKSSGAIIGWIVGLILFCGYFYDVSYDGQWYHQETVYQLKNGYDPVHQNLPVPADEITNNDCPVWCTGTDKPIYAYSKPGKPGPNLKYVAINHLSKGSEIIEAAVYSLTNRIETAKAVNGIILAASFFLCLSLLYKIDRISIPKKWLLAILFSFNPIAITQLLTFYVDGNVACLLLCVIVISCLLFIEINSFYLLLLATIIILAVNIKFTCLVYTGMYCIGFLVVLMVYKKMPTFKKVFITGIFSAVMGICCCGFNPYITNIINQHNVFYGFDETRAEIQRIEPPIFKNFNRFENSFLSLVPHQWGYTFDKGPVWKMPFAINSQDIRAAGDPGQEVAGFGPFFSGALLIATILFIIALISVRTTRAFKFSIAVILIILSTLWITPYAWWARYVPQFWLIPVIIVGMIECILIYKGRFLKSILYLSLGLSVAWALLNIVFNVFCTSRIDYQLQQLKALNKPIKVEYCTFQSFKSNRLRFGEYGIMVTEEKVAGPYVYNIVGSNTRFETPAALPQLPEPAILKLRDWIKQDK